MAKKERHSNRAGIKNMKLGLNDLANIPGVCLGSNFFPDSEPPLQLVKVGDLGTISKDFFSNSGVPVIDFLVPGIPPSGFRPEREHRETSLLLTEDFLPILTTFGTGIHVTLGIVLNSISDEINSKQDEVIGNTQLREWSVFRKIDTYDSSLVTRYMADFMEIAQRVNDEFPDKNGEPKSVWFKEINFGFRRLKSILTEVVQRQTDGSITKTDVQDALSTRRVSVSFDAESNTNGISDPVAAELLANLKVVGYLPPHNLASWFSARTDATRVIRKKDTQENLDLLVALEKVSHAELLNIQKLKSQTIEYQGKKISHLELIGEFFQAVAKGDFEIQIYDFKCKLTNGNHSEDSQTKETAGRRQNLGTTYSMKDGIKYLTPNHEYLKQLSGTAFGMLVWAEAVCAELGLNILSDWKKRQEFMKKITDMGIVVIKYPITNEKIIPRKGLSIEQLVVPEKKDIEIAILHVPRTEDSAYNKILLSYWRAWKYDARKEYQNTKKTKK